MSRIAIAVVVVVVMKAMIFFGVKKWRQLHHATSRGAPALPSKIFKQCEKARRKQKAELLFSSQEATTATFWFFVAAAFYY
jgi:hypothetical protein